MNKSILFAMVTLLLLTACEVKLQMPPPGDQPKVVNVNGVSEFDAAPDVAKIRFRIEIQSLTAQDAQSRNREIANNVRAALLQAGVRQNELETTDYRIDKLTEWDPKEQRVVERGYRVSNAFLVTTKKLDQVGPLLDVGVQAGANNIDSISFELSEEKQKEVKNEALRKASQNAREKAEALADGVGVRLGKVVAVNEQSYIITPYMPRYEKMVMGVEMAEAAPTPISPESVHVSAQVGVTFEIG